jgi:hypothetical protein
MNTSQVLKELDRITAKRPASKRIVVKGQDDCWNWTGGTNDDGYARIRVNKKKVLVHRLIFQIATGESIADKVIRHTCDNPLCQNPSHLLSGTILDNVNDRNARGRQAKGIKIAKSKLSEKQVNEIRRKYTPRIVTYKKLAAEFGICLRQVWMIVTKRNWRHC